MTAKRKKDDRNAERFCHLLFVFFNGRRFGCLGIFAQRKRKEQIRLSLPVALLTVERLQNRIGQSVVRCGENGIHLEQAADDLDDMSRGYFYIVIKTESVLMLTCHSYYAAF